jgi:hypothetical protein
MSSWSSVVIKKNKKTTNSISREETPARPNINRPSKSLANTMSSSEISTIFEEQYGKYIEDGIKLEYDSHKNISPLLETMSYVEIECFFYEFIDKNNSINIKPVIIENPGEMYGDDEF